MDVKLAKATSFRGGPIEVNGDATSGHTWEIQGAMLAAYGPIGTQVAMSATEGGLIDKLERHFSLRTQNFKKAD